MEHHAVIEALARQFLDALDMIGRQVGAQRDRHRAVLEIEDQGIFGIACHYFCSLQRLTRASATAGVVKGADIAAQKRDFLDQPRGDRLMARIGHQEHGLDLGVEALVHRHHLEFIFEVRHRAQAADDHRGADLVGEFDQQRVEGHDLDGGAARRQLARLRASPSPPARRA